MGDAERMLIHKALRFAVWAAGEGIAPVDGEPARDPEEFLTDYSAETDDEDWETLPERIIDAIEAQLAARTGGVKVKVKALEWQGTNGDWHSAYAEFGGLYRITEYPGMAEPYKLDTHGWWEGLPCGFYKTLEEAKAAAQADYERRILSALSPAPEAQQEPPQAAMEAEE